MAGPMLTVITPGFLTKAFFAQNSPALCATGLESARLTGRDARAFREDDDPVARLETLAPLFGDLAQGILSGAAVDRNHLDRGEGPAEKGNPQQRALEHKDERRKDRLQADGLPGRLVFGENDRGRGGNILAPDHFIVQTQHVAADGHETGAPNRDQSEAHAHRQDHGERDEKAEGRGDQGGKQEKQGRAEERDHSVIS